MTPEERVKDIIRNEEHFAKDAATSAAKFRGFAAESEAKAIELEGRADRHRAFAADLKARYGLAD